MNVGRANIFWEVIIMRKYLCWFLMAVLALASLHSGCGGSSGGSSGDPTTTYEFSTLEGTSTVSNGSGTATGPGGNFELRLNAERTASAGGVTFSNVQASENVQAAEDSVTLRISSNVYWDVYQNGTNVTTQLIDHSGELTFRRTSGNTWTTGDSSNGATLTITSSGVAKVEEAGSVVLGSDTYRYQVSYTITNQSTPENPTSPDNPATPDTPSTVYDFSILSGTWIPSNGSGSASGSEVNATMTLKGGQVSLTNATSGGSVQVSSNIRWDAVQNGLVLVSDVRDNFGGSGNHTFTRVSGNTWRYSGSDSDGPYSTTVTITSPTTATVERDGYYSDDDFSGVHFRMTYTITKQSTPTTPDNPITENTLSGTWRITGGALGESVLGEIKLTDNYIQGSASAEQFTLTLSEAGDGRYVLSISGGGVKEKEGSPYVEAHFEGINDEVRVVWGTSEDWEDWPYGDGSTYKLTNTNTYSSEFPIVTHDVTSASYQLMSDGTVRYKQSGPSIHGDDRVVEVELTLERVN